MIIASKYGAILAHIQPLPSLQPSADLLGYDNIRSMMEQVSSLYDQYRGQSCFPSADTVIVCALFKGSIGMPDQLDLIRQYLEGMGLNPTIRTYNVPPDKGLAGQGTVIVESKTNQETPTILVEDRPI